MNEERILEWAEYELKTNKEVIEDVSAQQVRTLIQENDYVMVFLCKRWRPCDAVTLRAYYP